MNRKVFFGAILFLGSPAASVRSTAETSDEVMDEEEAENNEKENRAPTICKATERDVETTYGIVFAFKPPGGCSRVKCLKFFQHYLIPDEASRNKLPKGEGLIRATPNTKTHKCDCFYSEGLYDDKKYPLTYFVLRGGETSRCTPRECWHQFSMDSAADSKRYKGSTPHGVGDYLDSENHWDKSCKDESETDTYIVMPGHNETKKRLRSAQEEEDQRKKEARLKREMDEEERNKNEEEARLKQQKDQDERTKRDEEERQEASFRDGATVILQGLQSRPEWNGKRGTLISFNNETLRWEVEIEGGIGTKALKQSNLVLVPEHTATIDAPASQAQGCACPREYPYCAISNRWCYKSATSWESTSTCGGQCSHNCKAGFCNGATVVLQGLQSRPEWNGKRGTLTSFNMESFRWNVEIEGGIGTKALKPSNLVHVQDHTATMNAHASQAKATTTPAPTDAPTAAPTPAPTALQFTLIGTGVCRDSHGGEGSITILYGSYNLAQCWAECNGDQTCAGVTVRVEVANGSFGLCEKWTVAITADGNAAYKCYAKPGQLVDEFDMVDANHDGLITREEYIAYFDATDANNDGTVTREEFNAFKRQARPTTASIKAKRRWAKAHLLRPFNAKEAENINAMANKESLNPRHEGLLSSWWGIDYLLRGIGMSTYVLAKFNGEEVVRNSVSYWLTKYSVSSWSEWQQTFQRFKGYPGAAGYPSVMTYLSNPKHVLQLAVLKVGPNHDFNTHLHGSVEFVVVLAGTLYEYNPPGSGTPRSLPRGSYILNVVGSRHRSYTCSDGVIIMALFAGLVAHQPEPNQPSDEIQCP